MTKSKGESVDKNVVLKQDEDAPVPVEVLAAGIKAISEGVRKLRAGPLNEDALVLLLVDATPAIYYGYKRIKMTAKHIRAVLEGMQSLEATFLKKKPKP